MTKFRAPKIFILAMVAVLTSSLPTAPLAARSNDFDGLFAICPGVLWKGEACQSLEWKSGQCYIVPPTLRGTVQSASPHQGTSGICTLYHGNNCLGEGTPPIAYPGIDNFEMSGLYSPFQSWRCVKAPF